MSPVHSVLCIYHKTLRARSFRAVYFFEHGIRLKMFYFTTNKTKETPRRGHCLSTGKRLKYYSPSARKCYENAISLRTTRTEHRSGERRKKSQLKSLSYIS